VVPVFESRLYSLPESELIPERITALARDCERQVLGIAPAPRPLLSIPHLLSNDGSCSYQGYLLAHMAVYQTRAYFLARDGFITDNPRVGPTLAEHSWSPGNSRSHREIIRSLTGEDLSGRELAALCNLESKEYWERSRARMRHALDRARAPEPPSQVTLDAEIRIVHGNERIADNRESMTRLWSDFERWVNAKYFGG
jgi:hypothetical protein